MEFNNPSTQAFRVTSLSDSTATDPCYFVFSESRAYLIKNKALINEWTVTQTLFDSNGGEIITKEGDKIYLSIDILIKKITGEEMAFQYEPIDVNEIFA